MKPPNIIITALWCIIFALILSACAPLQIAYNIATTAHNIGALVVEEEEEPEQVWVLNE